MRLVPGVAMRARGQRMTSATPGVFPPTLTLVFHRTAVTQAAFGANWQHPPMDGRAACDPAIRLGRAQGVD